VRHIGLAAAVGYVATIFAANWLIQHVGIVPVGFGLSAPAGVFAAGLALTLRDIVQATLGRAAVVLAILIGAALSWLVSPSFAVASATAFLVHELVVAGSERVASREAPAVRRRAQGWLRELPPVGAAVARPRCFRARLVRGSGRVSVACSHTPWTYS
jgi:hypothetical protein